MIAPSHTAPVAEVDTAAAEVQRGARQRKSIKPMKIGDQVEVYSHRYGEWMLDAEVVEFVSESCIRDDLQVRAGSMKVIFNSGRQFRWLEPVQFADFVRPSLRPAPPPRLTGRLSKETHNWLTEWHQRFFLLDHGFMEWWESERDMLAEKAPNKAFSLLGLHMMEPVGDGTRFTIRTDGTKGVLYSFDGFTVKDTRQWVEAIWEHAEYCEELTEMEAVKEQGVEVRRELLSSLEKRRASRKSLRSLPPELRSELLSSVQQRGAAPAV